MSQDDLFGAPAGWYPDPLGLPQLRWWNNHAWTEQTSAARQPMVVQDTKFAWADDELPSRREERERERQNADRKPAATAQPTAEVLRELEPPRAMTKIQENRGAPAAPTVTPESTFTATPAAAQPTFQQQQPAQQPAAQQPTQQQQPVQQPAQQQQQPTYASAAPSAPAAPSAQAAAAEAAARSAEALFSAAPAAATPTAAPAAPAASFDSLFDGSARTTAAPTAQPATGSLDALFGAETAAPRGQKRTAPILPQAPIQSARSGKSTSTAPAWVIAMIPLFQLVVSLLFLTAFGLGTLSGLFIAILTVPYLVVVALAYFDHRALVAAGHDRPAHWAFAFATAPVYLLMRARSSIRETGHGIGPVLVWFGLGLLHVVSVVAVPGLIIALLPAMFSSQIEQSVARDAALIGGSEMTVTCPAAPPLLPGQEIICQGVNSSGNRTNITVTYSRANGWIGWDVTDWGVYGTADAEPSA